MGFGIKTVTSVVLQIIGLEIVTPVGCARACPCDDVVIRLMKRKMAICAFCRL